MRIIEAVSKADRPLAPAELSCLLEIPKPSIYRLLNQLQNDRFVQTNLRGMIVPGERMLGVAWGVLHNQRFGAVRRAILERLTEEIGETCGIAIPNGSQMVYYDRVQSNWPLQLNLNVGSHTPVWCTASGKLYLSSLPKQRREQIIQHLPLQRYAQNTMIDPKEIESELIMIKQRKMATDNEEFVDGMVGCAVPITDHQQRLCGCLFIHAPLIRKSLDDLLAQATLLHGAASKLGTSINSSESYSI
jgi:IclR family acetate operon transcriptional repressor